MRVPGAGLRQRNDRSVLMDCIPVKTAIAPDFPPAAGDSPAAGGRLNDIYGWLNFVFWMDVGRV